VTDLDGDITIDADLVGGTLTPDTDIDTDITIEGD
jgi:hypothetical protein